MRLFRLSVLPALLVAAACAGPASAATQPAPGWHTGTLDGTSKHASACGTKYWFGRRADGVPFAYASASNPACWVSVKAQAWTSKGVIWTARSKYVQGGEGRYAIVISGIKQAYDLKTTIYTFVPDFFVESSEYHHWTWY